MGHVLLARSIREGAITIMTTINTITITIATTINLTAQGASRRIGHPHLPLDLPGHCVGLLLFEVLIRLEICQKIYTTEDFRVKNLHRKRVILFFVKSRQKVRKCLELG